MTPKHVKLAIADTESAYRSPWLALSQPRLRWCELGTVAVMAFKGPEQLIDSVMGLLHTLGAGVLS